MDLRDYGLCHLLEQVCDLDAGAPERPQVLRARKAAELGDVDAGAERGTRAAEHDTVDIVRVGRIANGLSQLEHHFAVDRVSLLRPIHDDVLDAVLLLNTHVIAHLLGSRPFLGARLAACSHDREATWRSRRLASSAAV